MGMLPSLDRCRTYLLRIIRYIFYIYIGVPQVKLYLFVYFSWNNYVDRYIWNRLDHD